MHHQVYSNYSSSDLYHISIDKFYVILISYKWNHTVYSIVYVASLILRCLWASSWCCVCQYYSFFFFISVFHHMNLLCFTHSFYYWWTFGLFLELWVIMPKAVIKRSDTYFYWVCTLNEWNSWVLLLFLLAFPLLVSDQNLTFLICQMNHNNAHHFRPEKRSRWQISCLKRVHQ